MDPRRVTGEFLNEHRASDSSAAFAATDILNVGDGALDEFAIFVVNGHLPHFFAGCFGAGEQFVSERLVRAKDANVDIGQRNDDGAGESGSIYQMRGAELLRVVEAIGKN